MGFHSDRLGSVSAPPNVGGKAAAVLASSAVPKTLQWLIEA